MNKLVILALSFAAIGASAEAAKKAPYQYFTSEAAFRKATAPAKLVAVEGFDDVPGYCVISNGSVSPSIQGTYLTATNLVATLSPNSNADVFLCVVFNELDGLNGLRAGSNTGSDWILIINFTAPTEAFGFNFSDAANAGPLEFLQPSQGASTLIAPCCDGPHEGFFGFVSKTAFTQVLIRSPAAGDDASFRHLRVVTAR